MSPQKSFRNALQTLKRRILKYAHTRSPRRLLFLAVLFLPLIVVFRPISNVLDSMLVFIPFILILSLAYYPWTKQSWERVEKEFKKALEKKPGFYFIRTIERVMGEGRYYIFCLIVSSIIFVLSYKFLVVDPLLTEDTSALYWPTSASVSIFLGLAFWKPVTEELSKLVEEFYRHYGKDEKVRDRTDTDHVKSALLFHGLIFNDLFGFIWGLFWGLLIVTWAGFPSMILSSTYDIFLIGLQFFVQSTTIAISGCSIIAIFQIGRASSFLTVDETAIFQKSFGEFFENLGRVVLRIAVMQLLVPGLIMPNIVLSSILLEQFEAGVLVGVFWFILGQVLVFLLAIYGAHMAMMKLKKNKERDLKEEMSKKRILLQTADKSSFAYVNTLLDYRLLILQSDYLDSISTWPIGAKGGLGFTTLLVGTVLNILRDYLPELLS